MKIKLSWQNGELAGTLNSSATAIKIAGALPFKSAANTWGKEVYFSIPVADVLASDAKDVVEPGTICFWTQGSSLAIPFGPTPASKGNECRLVTRVNIVGKIEGDSKKLETISDGMEVRVEAVPS